MNRALAAAVLAVPLALAPMVPAVAATHATSPYSVVQHEPFSNPGKVNCNDSSTQGVEFCALAKTLATDKQIDSTASAIRKQRDAGAAKRFDAAQKAWVAFRTAECSSTGDIFEGGSQAAVIAAQCDESLSADRLKQLKGRLAGLKAEN